MFTLIAALHSDLRRRYAEPHRAHHDQRHIDALLAQWEQQRSSLHDPVAVELAIWFHDAVYQPGAKDNERQSEQLLRQSLAGWLDASVLDKAAAMILATERHALPPGMSGALAEDTAAFLDMDMSILGAGEAEYDRYATHIRSEFLPSVGEAAWLEGRAGFLRASLASATPLFHTASARAAFDAAARANMRRELAALLADQA